MAVMAWNWPANSLCIIFSVSTSRTVWLALSQPTAAPSACAAKRMGTYVRPPSMKGATSVENERSAPARSTVQALRPMVSLTVRSERLAVTVRLASSQDTVAPMVSKIARKGTKVRSSRMSGCASEKDSGWSFSVTWMPAARAGTAGSADRTSAAASAAPQMRENKRFIRRFLTFQRCHSASA